MEAVNETAAPLDLPDTRDPEHLFRAHYPGVARLIARLIRDPARAEELAVDLFLKLSESRTAVANPQAWLYCAAARAAIDELRRLRRRFAFENGIRSIFAPATPEQIHAATQEQDRVRTVLAALPPRHAQLLLLRSEDLTYSAIAAALRLNAASVGTLLARAQSAFRKEYEKRYGRP